MALYKKLVCAAAAILIAAPILSVKPVKAESKTTAAAILSDYADSDKELLIYGYNAMNPNVYATCVNGSNAVTSVDTAEENRYALTVTDEYAAYYKEAGFNVMTVDDVAKNYINKGLKDGKNAVGLWLNPNDYKVVSTDVYWNLDSQLGATNVADAVQKIKLCEKYGIYYYVGSDYFNEIAVNAESSIPAWANLPDQIYNDLIKAKNLKNCIGFETKDEPSLEIINGSTGSYKRLIDRLNSFDGGKYQLFSSLLPMHGFSNSASAYKAYLDAYYENVIKGGLNTKAAFDYYPLGEDGIFTYTTGKSYKTYLYNYQLLANHAADKGYETGATIGAGVYGKTSGYSVYPEINEPDYSMFGKTELAYQAYTALSYGVKQLNYWAYSPYFTFSSDTQNMLVDTCVDRFGNRTANWYAAKELNADLHAIEKVFLNFDYVGTNYYGSNYYIDNVSEKRTFTDASVTSNTAPVLMSKNYDKTHNRYGYWLVNQANPDGNSLSVNVVKAKFGGYGKALVFKDGAPLAVDLAGGVLSLNLSAGEGVFVVPFDGESGGYTAAADEYLVTTQGGSATLNGNVISVSAPDGYDAVSFTARGGVGASWGIGYDANSVKTTCLAHGTGIKAVTVSLDLTYKQNFFVLGELASISDVKFYKKNRTDITLNGKNTSVAGYSDGTSVRAKIALCDSEFYKLQSGGVTSVIAGGEQIVQSGDVINAYAEDAVVMKKGASVRFATVGIRFTCYYDKTTVDSFINDGYLLEAGVMIAPYNSAVGYEINETTPNVRVYPSEKYLNNVTVVGDKENYFAQIAIVGIPDANLDTRLVARGYIKLSVNGKTIYLYSLVGADNVRSIVEVAQMALNDTTANYTAEQRALLENILFRRSESTDHVFEWKW